MYAFRLQSTEIRNVSVIAHLSSIMHSLLASMIQLCMRNSILIRFFYPVLCDKSYYPILLLMTWLNVHFVKILILPRHHASISSSETALAVSFSMLMVARLFECSWAADELTYDFMCFSL
jgi:hypothetical protein